MCLHSSSTNSHFAQAGDFHDWFIFWKLKLKNNSQPRINWSTQCTYLFCFLDNLNQNINLRCYYFCECFLIILVYISEFQLYFATPIITLLFSIMWSARLTGSQLQGPLQQQALAKSTIQISVIYQSSWQISSVFKISI